MDAVWAALVSGGLALIGTVFTVNASQKKTQTAVENTMKTELAVMNTKLENLTKEVEKHNNFAERVPRLEGDLDTVKQDVHMLQTFHLHA